MISEKEKIVFLKKGKEAEREFAANFKNAIEATPEEDMKNHVDLKVTYRIDIKGLKKKNRSDNETNEMIHWVEFHNVQGKLGWLYGEADYFAFELKEYWLIVDKFKLQDFLHNKVIKEYMPKPELYRLYRREGRKDSITLVSSIDLCYICDKFIKK
jgi:hypothetical protein